MSRNDKRESELVSLARGVRRCRKCPLHKSRTHAVPGEGDGRAAVMFIGEAPGEKEDVEGRPFVGRSGTFLDKLLDAIGLPRESAYITSSVKCRPPGNRDPRDAELEVCRRAWLERQVELIDPELIVLLGRIAVRQVLGEGGKLANLRRGVRQAGGRRVMVTYHPTAGMRFPDTEKRMRYDFRKLRRLRG